MAEQKPDERRRYLRYPPDATEVVMLQFSGQDAGTDRFRPEIAALPSEESRSGLRLVVLDRKPLSGVKEGATCTVKVASLGPQRATVRWIKPVDDEIVQLGLELMPD